MSAQIFQFSKRGRGVVWVERDRTGGEWFVIHGGNAWPCSSHAHALREAAELADQWGAAVVAEGEA
jgi:hypothetical protein